MQACLAKYWCLPASLLGKCSYTTTPANANGDISYVTNEYPVAFYPGVYQGCHLYFRRGRQQCKEFIKFREITMD